MFSVKLISVAAIFGFACVGCAETKYVDRPIAVPIDRPVFVPLDSELISDCKDRPPALPDHPTFAEERDIAVAVQSWATCMSDKLAAIKALQPTK